MVKLNGSNLKEYNKSFLGKGKRFIRDSRNFFRTVNEKHRILLRLSVNSNNDQFNEIYNLNKKLIKLGNRLVNDEKALFFLAKYIFEELGYGIRETRRRDLKQQEQLRKARMPLIKNQLNQHINSIESHIEQQTNIKENELDQALEAKQKLLWLQQEINYYE